MKAAEPGDHWGIEARVMRLIGVGIILLSALPWHLLLRARASGPAAEQALRLGPLYIQGVWTGAFLGVVMALVLSGLIRGRWPTRAAGRTAAALASVSAPRFGVLCGAFAAGLSGWVSVVVLNGQPVLLDGIAQLIHARYLAAGQLAGPNLEDPAFWQFQFMLATDHGWISQYPPGFVVALAFALSLGLGQILGPVLLGVAVYMTSLVADRLFPDDTVVARIAVILTALSPFLAFHAASYMNHTLALALALLAVLGALRSAAGSWLWSIVVGTAVGALLLTRPYTGVYYGFPAIVLMLGIAPGMTRLSRRATLARLVCASVAMVPFLVLLAAHNRLFFGDATLFGYVAAEGLGHGLGFHVDPWGSHYGLMEALAYTSADLASLSLDLLQGPVPALFLIGVYLLLGLGRPNSGLSIAAGLALIPVGAHVIYWHHDLFMGPRLLYEAVPWWCMLLAFSAVGLLRRAPVRLRVPGGLMLAPRNGLGTMFLIATAVGVLYAAPQKLLSYAVVVPGPTVAVDESNGRPTIVFVHTDWEDRLAARLVAQGMRLDSVRAMVRQNSSCSIEHYLGSNGDASAPMISADVTGGPDPALREVQMPSGSVVRTFDGEELSASCERQAASDFDGVLALPPLIWRGDLPGLEATGNMFVRDLGPERNARLLTRFAEREPRVLVRARNGQIRMLPYSIGMETLWSSATSQIEVR